MTPDFLTRVKDFAEAELTGESDRFDGVGQPPPLDLYRRLHQRGLAHWWLPAAEGGVDASVQDSVDIVSTLAYGDAGVAFTLFIPIVATTLLRLYGADLYRRYVLPMAAAGGFSALAFSEHDAGSELIRTGTSMARDGDEIVLNGIKAFSTNADFAEFILVLTRDADQPHIFHTVVVPRHTPGLRIGKRWLVNGIRATATYELSFVDCRISAANILDGPGIRVLEVGLNALRILMGATAVGTARRIRDLCMDYAAKRPLAGATLLDNAVFAAKVGQMEVDIDVMRNQCLSAARELDSLLSGPDAPNALLRLGTQRSALAAKMFCGQSGWNIAATASEMFGGLGYTAETAIGKLLRDIRFVSILDGGDDVLRQLVYARYVIPEHQRI